MRRFAILVVPVVLVALVAPVDASRLRVRIDVRKGRLADQNPGFETGYVYPVVRSLFAVVDGGSLRVKSWRSDLREGHVPRKVGGENRFSGLLNGARIVTGEAAFPRIVNRRDGDVSIYVPSAGLRVIVAADGSYELMHTQKLTFSPGNTDVLLQSQRLRGAGGLLDQKQLYHFAAVGAGNRGPRYSEPEGVTIHDGHEGGVGATYEVHDRPRRRGSLTRIITSRVRFYAGSELAETSFDGLTVLQQPKIITVSVGEPGQND